LRSYWAGLALVGVVSQGFSLGCQRKSEHDKRPPTTERLAPTERQSPTEIPELTVAPLPAGAGITIDGVLNEAAWAHAASTGNFVNVGTGAINTSDQIGGRARLLWNSRVLYLGIEITDADIRGDFEQNAVDPHLWTESTAEVMVDPDGDGDNRDYYEIQLGPQDLVFDSQFDAYNQPRKLPSGPFGHQEWSAHAKHAVVLRGTLNDASDKDIGYTIEAEIPWSSFDKAQVIPPKPGHVWRMNFYAMHNNSGVAWSPILGQGNFHKASRFGKVKWGSAR